jgi:hypothetical protein
MMPLEGDRSRTILAMAVSRMWRDPEYKEQFINDPKRVLSGEGVNFADDVTVKVVEETPTIKYVDLAHAAGAPEAALRQFLPIPDGEELRVVQGTDNLSYVVVPPAPAWIAPGAKADDMLIAQQEAQIEVVAETSVETLVVVDQNTEVEVQELVQAQLVTTESEIVEFEAQVSIEMAS